ncbi:DUF5719 family protein, partial [Actinotalea sp. C106]|uniref:DUF5719 family protein n=1 Tax=Actinotalea sp. C106 TaxID=2908644 RepID=UPI0020286BED
MVTPAAPPGPQPEPQPESEGEVQPTPESAVAPSATRVDPDGREQVRRAARVGRVLARTGTGLLVLGLAGAVTVLGTLEPPTVSSAAPLATVAVPAAGTTLVCPGTVRVPTEPEEGEDVAYDPQFDPSPGESVARLGALVVDGAGGSLAGLDGAGSSRLEGTGGVVVQQRDEADQGLVLRGEPADPQEGGPAWDAGAVTATTIEGDLRGLAAAPCQRPATDVWLVGGSTALGSSSRLVLQNPGRTAATVQLDLWGPAGQAEVAGSPEYLVPPTSERVVLLEGVAAEQRRVVVHLTASGGLVTAYLQDSEVRGLVPAGVDHVSAGQAPALRQVVPGIAVTDSELDGTDTAQLRLLAPGETGTSARVTFLGPDGVAELPGTDQVDLDAGEVLDLPLGGLPAGRYTAVVQADEPVVTGALVTRGESAGRTAVDADDPLDRAWVASAAVGEPAGSLALP